MTSPALLPSADHALVLTYSHGDSANSPYRSQTAESVRFWGLWIGGLGIACLDLEIVLLGLWALGDYIGADPLRYTIGLNTYSWFWWRGGGGPPTLTEVLRDCLRQTWPILPVGVLLFSYGVTLRTLVQGVAEARKSACLSAFFLIAPLALFFGATTLGTATVAVFYGTPLIIGSDASPSFLLLLIASALLACLLILSARTSYRLLAVSRSPGAGMEVSGGLILPPADIVETSVMAPATPATDSSDLPRARVLSYVAHANTPTRVRRVASAGVLIVGSAVSLGGAAAWVHFLLRVRQDLAWRFPGMAMRAYLDAIYNVALDETGLFTLALFTVPSFVLLLFARPIRRGSTAASLLSFMYLAALIPVIMLLTVLIVGSAIILYHPIQGGVEPKHLLWLLTIPPAVFLVLLLKDLCAFLLWIARHPATEKMPVPFLSRGKPSIKPSPEGGA